MFFTLIAILFKLNSIEISKTCCSTTFSPQISGKFSKIGLEAICNACSVHQRGSYNGNDLSFGIMVKYYGNLHPKFMSMLINNYDS
ncbi:MAG: hypothetical protein MHMPM18_002994, partial [Marteilia pararefringens]